MLRLRSAKSGGPVALGSEIARGGEGAIYEVQGTPLAAKVYLKEPDPQKIAKITAMTTVAVEALTKISAWPTDVVSDDRGKTRGFLMPRVGSRADAHELYSPKSRTHVFPQADFRFLVHVAGNVARAFAIVHGQGHVIGDINHGHLLVGQDGRVVLIDVDSFQVNINGKLFTCDVGTPLFTPPELQSRPFRGLVRTANHDLFGLAVILFHLLFMGRHPYAGVWRGPGDMPIERAIAENRFAYGTNAARFQIGRPPATLQLDAFGPAIASLFESAFSAAPNPKRPTATEWIGALGALAQSLQQCTKSQAHFYPKQSSACPWCVLERATGVRLFGVRGTVQWTGVGDISQLWKSIEHIPRPPVDPPLPSQQPWTPPPGTPLPDRGPKLIRQAASVALISFGLVGCMVSNGNGIGVLAIILFIAAWFVWPRVSEEKRRAQQQKIASARARWEDLGRRWIQEASVTAFDRQKQDAQKAKTELEDIPNERQRRLAKLRTDQREYQRHRFLDRFRIDRAKIRGIGSGRAAILASFGIETAYDVEARRVMNISGFGPSLTAELIEWKRVQEAKFSFNPNEPIDPAEISRVESEIAALRATRVQKLKLSGVELARLSQEIPLARARLSPALARAWEEFKVAELELKAL